MVNAKKQMRKKTDKIIVLGIISEILVGIIWGFVGNYTFDNTVPSFSFTTFYFMATVVSFILAIIVASFLYQKEKSAAIFVTLTLCLTILGALAAVAFTVAMGIMKWN